jgi:hypothetical protein
LAKEADYHVADGTRGFVPHAVMRPQFAHRQQPVELSPRITISAWEPFAAREMGKIAVILTVRPFRK